MSVSVTPLLSFRARRVFDDGFGSRTYDYEARTLREGVSRRKATWIKIGQVYNSGPGGRWSWIDWEGKTHAVRWGCLPSRLEAALQLQEAWRKAGCPGLERARERD